jgi:hypothetical protein
MDVARFTIESLIAAIGLFIGYLGYRHQRINIASDRIRSYRRLWEVMETARMTRLWGVDPFQPQQTRAPSPACV